MIGTTTLVIGSRIPFAQHSAPARYTAAGVCSNGTRVMEEMDSLTGSYGSSSSPESDRSKCTFMSAGAMVQATLIENRFVLLLSLKDLG
jgi:hypothetical protein